MTRRESKLLATMLATIKDMIAAYELLWDEATDGEYDKPNEQRYLRAVEVVREFEEK